MPTDEFPILHVLRVYFLSLLLTDLNRLYESSTTALQDCGSRRSNNGFTENVSGIDFFDYRKTGLQESIN